MEIKYKQMIILNKSLKMSLPKSCAMTAHSSYLALKEQEKTAEGKKLINKWLKNGECVIVLEAYNSAQLLGIEKYLNRKKIPVQVYIDEGITEVAMGESTCLATGVLTEEESEFLSTMNLYSDSSKMEPTTKQIYPIFGKTCINCGKLATLKEDSPDGEPHYYCSEECLMDYHVKENSKGFVWRCLPPTKYKFEWGKKPKDL